MKSLLAGLCSACVVSAAGCLFASAISAVNHRWMVAAICTWAALGCFVLTAIFFASSSAIYKAETRTF